MRTLGRWPIHRDEIPRVCSATYGALSGWTGTRRTRPGMLPMPENDSLVQESNGGACIACGGTHCYPVGHQREIEQLQAALRGVRGVVLGPLGDSRKKVELINEIVGEALYEDFEGTLEIAYKNGWAVR